MSLRTLTLAGLAPLALAGCVVHDGGKSGDEPAWWPAFVLRDPGDPLAQGHPPTFGPVDTGRTPANPLNLRPDPNFLAAYSGPAGGAGK